MIFFLHIPFYAPFFMHLMLDVGPCGPNIPSLHRRPQPKRLRGVGQVSQKHRNDPIPRDKSRPDMSPVLASFSGHMTYPDLVHTTCPRPVRAPVRTFFQVRVSSWRIHFERLRSVSSGATTQIGPKGPDRRGLSLASLFCVTEGLPGPHHATEA